MRRTMIKALLVAMFAILFFAVVPSVSASAATGPTPPPAPAPSLQPKDPSRDVVPPQGTVPLPVPEGCGVSTPCSNIDDSDGPALGYDSDSIVISVREYNTLNDDLYAAQIRGFFAGIGAVAASLMVVVLLLAMSSMSRRHRKELESKKATPSYTLH